MDVKKLYCSNVFRFSQILTEKEYTLAKQKTLNILIYDFYIYNYGIMFFLDKYTITAMSLLGSQVWFACLAFKHRRYNAVGVHALAQVCFCRLKQGGQLRPCNGSVQGN